MKEIGIQDNLSTDFHTCIFMNEDLLISVYLSYATACWGKMIWEPDTFPDSFPKSLSFFSFSIQALLKRLCIFPSMSVSGMGHFPCQILFIEEN